MKRGREAAGRATIEQTRIRAFTEADRETVRAIFRHSGQRGNPLSTYVEDELLVRPLFIDYYLDHEADSCLVAEVNGTVVGYLVGCPDTRRYGNFVALQILPRLMLRVLWKILTFQYRQRKTYTTIWWALTRAWRELPRPPLDRYPAHCHLAIEDGYRHLHLGRRLQHAFCDQLRLMGVPGLHGIVLEEVGKDAMAKALGVKLLQMRRTTVWDQATGKRWDAKLLGRDV